MENRYRPVIGLEVHVELKTKSKMFCSCSAEYFGHEPNTHVCPVCLGLPGALPVPNKTAIDWCVMIGLALNCQIQLFSKFDRKNYFYPDLPKGYQISQYDKPFCKNGKIALANGREIRIRRVHMEEDTGKLIHATTNAENITLIDFNRSGVPLVEIVTEPDFGSAEEVKEYLQKLQQVLRYLDVSNADMEKGEMRLEPNISLASGVWQAADGQNQEPPYKVEVKNINSFRFVERAIDYELERQAKILEEEQVPTQETRGWDEKKQVTVSQRTKEEAQEYRYFPEPDIPPIRLTESQIENFKSQIPELPDEKVKRFVSQYSITPYDAQIITRERLLADYFEKAADDGSRYGIKAKQIANFIINKKPDLEKMLPKELIQTIINQAKTVKLSEEELREQILTVFTEQKKAVEDYKSGKTEALKFLIGQVMRKSKEKIDANQVQQLIENMLK